MSRKTARKHAFIILYQLPFHADIHYDTILETYLAELEEVTSADHAFILAEIEGTHTHLPELDQLISDYTDGWSFERLSKIDLAIMRLAAYEMIYVPEIPVKVAINEAVELAKEYGTDHSSGFVNGVLGQIYMRNKESIFKQTSFSKTLEDVEVHHESPTTNTNDS